MSKLPHVMSQGRLPNLKILMLREVPANVLSDSTHLYRVRDYLFLRPPSNLKLLVIAGELLWHAYATDTSTAWTELAVIRPYMAGLALAPAWHRPSSVVRGWSGASPAPHSHNFRRGLQIKVGNASARITEVRKQKYVGQRYLRMKRVWYEVCMDKCKQRTKLRIVKIRFFDCSMSIVRKQKYVWKKT